jgi:hypothetical protein
MMSTRDSNDHHDMRNSKKTRHARKMLDRVLFTKKKKEKDTRKIKKQCQTRK